MRRWLLLVLAIGMVAAISLGVYGYSIALSPNVKDGPREGYSIRIPHGAGFDYVLAELTAGNFLESPSSFERVARFRGYPDLVKPGYYKIKPRMSNWDLVKKLRSGAQDEMKLSFRSHRALNEIATDIGGQMEFGAEALEEKLRDDTFLAKYGFSAISIRSLLIPNTYRVYWTMTLEEFFEKMKSEYDQFWNDERKSKAHALDLSLQEVTTLASIVQAETYMSNERPTVAGLYLNRLRDNIPLQADPTVIFAHGDWSIRRVLFSHLEIDSPYNTYKYAGLPPGPINNPEPGAVDAVLNPETHSYLFMCAKADFSGYHAFATTLAQHNRNAQAYQAAMNRKRVFR